jgi:hypothetical protein
MGIAPPVLGDVNPKDVNFTLVELKTLGKNRNLQRVS